MKTGRGAVLKSTTNELRNCDLVGKELSPKCTTNTLMLYCWCYIEYMEHCRKFIFVVSYHLRIFFIKLNYKEPWVRTQGSFCVVYFNFNIANTKLQEDSKK